VIRRNTLKEIITKANKHSKHSSRKDKMCGQNKASSTSAAKTRRTRGRK